MTKNKTILVNNKQMNLFDLLSQAREVRAEQIPGSQCISAQYLASVKQVLKQAAKSRETIADEMSFASGRTVTVSMINNWAADSHPHELSGEMEYYLCLVCGNDAPMRLKYDKLGRFTLDGPDALRADMQREIEQKREIDKRIRQKEALIKALEVER